MAGIGPVLPALRLGHLAQDVKAITGDPDMARKVIDAVTERLEGQAIRWGNACPVEGCFHEVHHTNDSFQCIVHGRVKDVLLLVGFHPYKEGK